jgi:hypothetical protein
MPSERFLRAAENFNRFAVQTDAPGRCDVTLAFERPELVQAVSVWRDSAAGRDMPLRRDMNAHTLKPFLPNVVIVDVVDGDAARRYQIRLIGTTVSRVLGDLTGKFLDEAVVSPYRERWCAAVDTAVNAGCPIRLSGRLEYGGQDYIAMDIMLAPIGERDDRPEAVLAVIYPKYSARHVFEPMVKNALAGKIPLPLAARA